MASSTGEEDLTISMDLGWMGFGEGQRVRRDRSEQSNPVLLAAETIGLNAEPTFNRSFYKFADSVSSGGGELARQQELSRSCLAACAIAAPVSSTHKQCDNAVHVAFCRTQSFPAVTRLLLEPKWTQFWRKESACSCPPVRACHLLPRGLCSVTQCSPTEKLPWQETAEGVLSHQL
eukprot:3835893-Rhodomonas_salina.4